MCNQFGLKWKVEVEEERVEDMRAVSSYATSGWRETFDHGR
jgi:hypothetical protein